MDDGLFAVAELVFLLDHGGPIGRLALLDDRGPVAIGCAIFMGFAHRHAGADGTDTHANVIGECGSSDRTHERRGEQIALHGLSSDLATARARKTPGAIICSGGTS